MIVDGYVTMRQLIREPATWFSEIERDGRVLAISRHGRLVAIVCPFPDRVTFELGAGRQADEDDSPPVELGLDETAEEMLRRAHMGEPRWYDPPNREAFARYGLASLELEKAGLVTRSTFGHYSLTPRGRRAAAGLTRRPASGPAPG